jgi:ATP-dependent DNA ligase
MRSLTDLQALAEEHGINTITKDGPIINGIQRDRFLHRSELMDALREKTGDFDPTVQIDPAKAQDLKNTIDWTKPGATRFEGLPQMTDEWVAEPKLDGARIRLFLGATINTMNTGRRSDTSYAYIERADNFPHLRDAVVPELAGTVLDAELMSPVTSLTTTSGVTTKGTLNSTMAMLNVGAEKAVRTQEQYGKAILWVFDVLMYGGESLMDHPLTKRREALDYVVHELTTAHPDCEVRLIPQFEATPANIQLCLDNGFEGAMLKKKDSRYLPGKRMSSWQKVKIMSTGDFFIIGSVDGKGRNAGKVGSLKVAFYDTNAPAASDGMYPRVYCADVAGISDAFRDELTGPDGKVDPKFIGTVIEVMAQGKTGKNTRLRHPHFVRLRPDKVVADCTPDCSIDLFTEV